MKSFTFLFALFLILSACPSSSGQIVRGTAPGEIYIYCFWCFSETEPTTRWGIFHSLDNGQTLSVQYKREPGSILKSDSLSGTIYLTYGPKIFRSQDFGLSWDTVPTSAGNGFASGCLRGEIYKHSSDTYYPGLYRSVDFGETFTSVNPTLTLDQILDVGTQPGELYDYRWDNFDTLVLKYSNDYGHSFTKINSDTSILDPDTLMNYPIISRGTSPGEFYLIRMDVSTRYRIFHTFNYGGTYDYNYITQPCLDCTSDNQLITFTAGREPGSFYISRAIVDSISQNHTILCIDYSQDYGITYTTNCFDLDSTFTGIGDIPAVARNDLKQNYPNPFTGQTSIGFYLEKPAFAEIAVFDIRGNQLSTLVSGKTGAGMHQVTWNGRSDGGRKLPAGIYYYRFSVDGIPAGTKKAVILQ